MIRTSAPQLLACIRSPREPGTLSMSPKVQKITPGSEAIWIARSIESIHARSMRGSGVTSGVTSGVSSDGDANPSGTGVTDRHGR